MKRIKSKRQWTGEKDWKQHCAYHRRIANERIETAKHYMTNPIWLFIRLWEMLTNLGSLLEHTVAFVLLLIFPLTYVISLLLALLILIRQGLYLKKINRVEREKLKEIKAGEQ